MIGGVSDRRTCRRPSHSSPMGQRQCVVHGKDNACASRLTRYHERARCPSRTREGRRQACSVGPSLPFLLKSLVRAFSEEASAPRSEAESYQPGTCPAASRRSYFSSPAESLLAGPMGGRLPGQEAVARQRASSDRRAPAAMREGNQRWQARRFDAAPGSTDTGAPVRSPTPASQEVVDFLPNPCFKSLHHRAI
jgi:hypothetical protein